MYGNTKRMALSTDTVIV